MTITERVESLDAAAGVLSAFTKGEVETIGGNLHTQRVEWVTTSGDVANSFAARLIVDEYGTETEAAYWLGELPAPLRPVVPEEKYLTARTVSGWGALTAAAQKAAIESFCNEVYKAAVAGARDIREFTVTPVDGTKVKVSGYFNAGQNNTTWERQTWYIRLIDANGSVAAPYSNIEFQRVIGE